MNDEIMRHCTLKMPRPSPYIQGENRFDAAKSQISEIAALLDKPAHAHRIAPVMSNEILMEI
jgi:hypothetical protein